MIGFRSLEAFLRFAGGALSSARSSAWAFALVAVTEGKGGEHPGLVVGRMLDG